MQYVPCWWMTIPLSNNSVRHDFSRYGSQDLSVATLLRSCHSGHSIVEPDADIESQFALDANQKRACKIQRDPQMITEGITDANM